MNKNVIAIADSILQASVEAIQSHPKFQEELEERAAISAVERNVDYGVYMHNPVWLESQKEKITEQVFLAIANGDGSIMLKIQQAAALIMAFDILLETSSNLDSVAAMISTPVQRSSREVREILVSSSEFIHLRADQIVFWLTHI